MRLFSTNGNSKIINNNNQEIIANNIEYNKLLNVINAKGKVEIKDIKKIIFFSQKIFHILKMMKNIY